MAEQQEKEIRILPIQLDEEELIKIGNELSQIQIAKEQLETEKAATVKGYNDQIKEKEVIISSLAHQINAGTKDEEVECYWTNDEPEAGKKSLIRYDTGEIVEVKDMDLFDDGDKVE